MNAEPGADPSDPLLKRRPEINPYRIGGKEILRRFLWDIRPESWRSRAKLRALKDSHRGEKAVVLCNGPSLNRVDLELLNGTFCFGLNKIHLLFPRTMFRPSAIVCINPLVVAQTADFYDATDIPLFLHQKGLRFVRARPNRVFIADTALSRSFARDCSMSVYPGHTVTYVALQLAYHMGFRSVALIGCDHEFHCQGPANKTVQGGPSDPNHFDPTYFANLPWQLPDLFESEVSYRMASNIYRASGRLLVNATDGGKLDILPRMSLNDFLGRPA